MTIMQLRYSVQIKGLAVSPREMDIRKISGPLIKGKELLVPAIVFIFKCLEFRVGGLFYWNQMSV